MNPIKELTARHHFIYGDEVIYFDCKTRPQASAKVLIKVAASGCVTVHKPSCISIKQMLNVVEQRKLWIYTKVCYFRAQQRYVTPREYVSGETHFYLGRRYRLQTTEQLNQKQSVKLYQGRLCISMRQQSLAKAKQLLQQWYTAKAKIIFAQQLDLILKQTPWVTKKPSMKVIRMRSQWGSCSASGNIVLNAHLVKASKLCIDYVIMHELCHIAEHNHSKRFYALLDQAMPNWRTIKAQLDNMAHYYLAES